MSNQTARRGRPPKRRTSPLTVLGIILLSAGLICLGYVAWEFYGTSVVSGRAATHEVTNLRGAWTQPPADPDPTESPAPEHGQAEWLLRIPRFGESYEWPILVGIDDEQLERGVGWYPDSALPGEVGNFALAGHRITRGEPFRHLLELEVGDQVIVETREAIFTYEINSPPSELTVNDTESWVLYPVPGKPDVEPTEAIITLTTCQDLFRSPDRSVGFGVLVNTELKQ